MNFSLTRKTELLGKSATGGKKKTEAAGKFGVTAGTISHLPKTEEI